MHKLKWCDKLKKKFWRDKFVYQGTASVLLKQLNSSYIVSFPCGGSVFFKSNDMKMSFWTLLCAMIEQSCDSATRVFIKKNLKSFSASSNFGKNSFALFTSNHSLFCVILLYVQVFCVILLCLFKCFLSINYKSIFLPYPSLCHHKA